MGPRFMQSVNLQRPTVNGQGDLVLPSGTLVSGAVWDRRRKQVVGGTGELFTVTAQGFLPVNTDVRERDRLTVSAGHLLGTAYDVVTVVSAFDDRGRASHVGVELRKA